MGRRHSRPDLALPVKSLRSREDEVVPGGTADDLGVPSLSQAPERGSVCSVPALVFADPHLMGSEHANQYHGGHHSHRVTRDPLVCRLECPEPESSLNQDWRLLIRFPFLNFGVKRLESVDVVDDLVLKEPELYELLIVLHEYTEDSSSLPVSADVEIEFLP